LSVKVTPLGRLGDFVQPVKLAFVMAGFGKPVVVTVKLPELPTRKLAALPLVMAGAVPIVKTLAVLVPVLLAPSDCDAWAVYRLLLVREVPTDQDPLLSVVVRVLLRVPLPALHDDWLPVQT